MYVVCLFLHHHTGIIQISYGDRDALVCTILATKKTPLYLLQHSVLAVYILKHLSLFNIYIYAIAYIYI